MTKAAFVAGLTGRLIVALLVGLWLLQGFGIVQMQPILCFANCDPIQGPSATWTVIGALMLAVDGATIFWSAKKPVR